MLILLWNMVLPEFSFQKLVHVFVAFQIMEPQVPEPGGLINTAGDKDCLLARVERHRTNITVVTLNSSNICLLYRNEITFKSKTFWPVSTLNCITFMSPEPEQPHMILKIYSWLVTIRRIFLSPSIQEIIIFYDFHLWGRSHRQGIWLRIEILHTWPT